MVEVSGGRIRDAAASAFIAFQDSERGDGMGRSSDVVGQARCSSTLAIAVSTGNQTVGALLRSKQPIDYINRRAAGGLPIWRCGAMMTDD